MVTAVRRQSPPAKRKVGRPKIAKPRYCRRCGKKLEVRPNRVKKGLGNYCKDCFNLLYRPPMLIQGKIRKKAGGPVCPHCHGYRQTYQDDTDICCLSCGTVLLSLNFGHP